MFRLRRKSRTPETPKQVSESPPKAAAGASSHWIDGPSEMAKAAMAYFGTGDQSQAKLLHAVHTLVPFASLVDFGTGRGSWPKAAIEMGVTDVRGYDIPEIPVEQRQFPPERFFPADLGQPVSFERRFDLSVSTEVAEHLPKQDAAQFVTNVCGPSDLVLFSAAIPYQGGAGHVNENWVEYWAKLFAENGFECFDILRMRFWNDASIRSYYRQNVLLFAKAEAAERVKVAGHAPPPNAPSLIHPEQYLKSIGRALPPAQARVGADVRHYYDCVTKPPAQVDVEDRHCYGKDGVGFGAIKAALKSS